MGVYLVLRILKAVTPHEWLLVYLETLELANAFHLAKRRIHAIHFPT